MRGLTVLSAAFAIAVTFVPVGHSSSTQQLHAREARQVATLRHDRHVLRFFQTHHSLAVTDRGIRADLHARAEIGWTQRELRRTRAYLKAQTRPALDVALVADFMCIHRHEGAWTDNTGNGFWGGLQFGWNEWQRFGGEYAARADLASPAEQIAAGIAYWRVSGFSPWPNSARACGLI